VGETKAETYATLEVVDAALPDDKPRYLMGVGTPIDLVEGVQRGMDIFDCVLPTRLARHNAAFCQGGRINLLNAAYTRDASPIDEDCSCYTCQHYSRAYLRHLIAAREMLSATLLSIHNLHTLIHLAAQIRQAILENRFETFAEQFKVANHKGNDQDG